jgi:hypothetical protein
MLRALADVAAKDEAVVWVCGECSKRFAIGLEAQVKIAHGIKTATRLAGMRLSVRL